MFPGVNITLENGNLGAIASTNDGIVGMMISGIDDSIVPFETPKQIFSLKEAEDLGINEAYDADNSVLVYKQIKDFYEQAGNGAELWFIIIGNTVLMADYVDKTKAYAPALLDAAEGKIRALGISRVPDATYNATTTHGIDDDVWNAMANAQLLADEYALQMKPLRILIGARQWTGVVADLQDLSELTNNRVALSLVGESSGSNETNIGYILGRIASIPVQRNIGRVKDNAVINTTAYLSDGTTVDSHNSEIEAIHTKGYILLRKYVNRGGYYFVDDPMATAETDDYHSLARGRVIDKALVLTYNTYVEEVNNEVEINTDGTLKASYVKALQASIENNINQTMTAYSEISSVKCTIDPTQNILSTNKLEISISIIPVGYAKEINVKLGFSNPLNQ